MYTKSLKFVIPGKVLLALKMLNGLEDGVGTPTFSTAKGSMAQMADFADSEPMMLDIPVDDPPVVQKASLLSDQELLLPPTFENPAPAAVDLDLSDNNSNLIDFDPSIFSLDLPETKLDADKS